MEVADLEVATSNINKILCNLFFNNCGKKRIKIIKCFQNNFYPNIKNYLDKNFSANTLEEQLYKLKYGLFETPKCPICNNNLKFLSFYVGYCKTCSYKCSRKLAALKTTKTKLERYGNLKYNNPEKNKLTCLKKYGKEYFYQTEEFKNKSKQTCLNKYNVEYSLLIKEIHDKGVKRAQDKDICEKRNNTIFKKYGVDNVSKSIEIKKKKKQTFLKHYGYENNFCSNEIQLKANGKLGIEKRFNTMKNNNSYKRSNEEDKCYELLKQKYPDTKRQYHSELYPFNCDFYIPSLDLYIEYNGLWTHGNHPYNSDNIDDQNKLQKWINKNTNYYRNAINVWTRKDIEKRNKAKENNLNYIEFWNLKEVEKYLCINK